MSDISGIHVTLTTTRVVCRTDTKMKVFFISLARPSETSIPNCVPLSVQTKATSSTRSGALRNLARQTRSSSQEPSLVCMIQSWMDMSREMMIWSHTHSSNQRSDAGVIIQQAVSSVVVYPNNSTRRISTPHWLLRMCTPASSHDHTSLRSLEISLAAGRSSLECSSSARFSALSG